MNSRAGAKPALERYAVAVGCVVLCWLARELVTPAIGPTALPYRFFFPAVVLAAWYGGFGPGVLAIVLSAVATAWSFAGPAGLKGLWELATFVIASSVIVWAVHKVHAARGKLANEIDDQEHARVDLQRARDLLQTTVSSIGDAVILTDEHGNTTFLNPEAERLTGWTDADANGQPLPIVFHIINERTRLPVEDPVEKVLRTGKVQGLANHTLLTSKDGTETDIDDSAAPIREGDGPVSGVVLVFRDVSEQRSAQQARERLANIVEHSGDAIVTKNLDSVIQTWNPAAVQLFGYREEEVVGKSVTIIFPPDRLNEEDYIIGLLRAGKAVERLETVRVAKNGRHIPVEVSVSPLRNAEGEVVGASKILRDISDNLAIREALLRERELLVTTLASIGDAVILTDAKGVITFLNTEAERLTQWAGDDAAGCLLPEVFRIINEDTRARVENPVEKVLRFGGVVGLANHTLLIGKDGTETPIDDSAAPIQRPGGMLYGVVLVFRDFTERREMEAKLRIAQKGLEAKVAERTAQLQDTANELQSLSYSIAHDMRAPLRAMASFANLLMQEVPAVTASEEGKSYCERIVVGAKRLDSLINDALNYTKTVMPEVPLQPVDLGRLVRGLLDTYPNLHADMADISIDGKLPVVLGNEALLTQCFSNLLGNAVKFVAPGARADVRIWPEGKGVFIRIWVADHGIGIPEHAQSRLFGIFQKLNSDYEGTGIGLAIVRKAVERMGGSVGYEAEPAGGSRFWVDLQLPAEGMADASN